MGVILWKEDGPTWGGTLQTIGSLDVVFRLEASISPEYLLEPEIVSRVLDLMVRNRRVIYTERAQFVA